MLLNHTHKLQTNRRAAQRQVRTSIPRHQRQQAPFCGDRRAAVILSSEGRRTVLPYGSTGLSSRRHHQGITHTHTHTHKPHTHTVLIHSWLQKQRTPHPQLQLGTEPGPTTAGGRLDSVLLSPPTPLSVEKLGRGGGGKSGAWCGGSRAVGGGGGGRLWEGCSGVTGG